MASAVTNIQHIYRKSNKPSKAGMPLKTQLIHSLQCQFQNPARYNLLSHVRESSPHLMFGYTDIQVH